MVFALACDQTSSIIKSEDLIGKWETLNAGKAEDDWRALEKLGKDPGNVYEEEYQEDGTIRISNQSNGKSMSVKGIWEIKNGQDIYISYEVNGEPREIIHHVVEYKDSLLYVEDRLAKSPRFQLRGILKRK